MSPPRSPQSSSPVCPDIRHLGGMVLVRVFAWIIECVPLFAASLQWDRDKTGTNPPTNTEGRSQSAVIPAIAMRPSNHAERVGFEPT